VAAPTSVPDVGRFAVLDDPQGATFAIFQPLSPGAPPAGMPAVGEFSWHELPTTDHAAAFAFYATLFGWAPTEAMDMGAQGVYQMFGQGGTTYGGIFNRMHAEVPPHWLHYVRVADLDRALDAVRQGGGHVLAEPMEVPGGDHIAQCVDPQGARFALHAASTQG
jgi:predicted enzyme related to lactoylglutathione lyase